MGFGRPRVETNRPKLRRWPWHAGVRPVNSARTASPEGSRVCGSMRVLPGIASPSRARPRQRDHMTKGDILVVRRFVTLTLSFCLVVGVGILQVGPSFGQGETKKAAQPTPPETAKKETAPGPAPATKEAQKAAEKGGPQGHRGPPAPDPQGGPGQDRCRSQGRGRGDRRGPGCRAGGDLDRSAADPRHPHHGPRDRRAHAQEQHREEAVRRQSRGLLRLVHGLRYLEGSTTSTTSGSSTPARGSSNTTSSARPS